ncbi:MAG: purK [Variovorax sp.]|nr:purK [Variovorax sp.]
MSPLLPGATLGVLGGGQLGRMFVHAAQRMGYFTAVLDPEADSPAGRISHHFVQADYLDIDGLARLAGLSGAITTEFENVPAQALDNLAVARRVAPAAQAVAIAQDRIAEKAHFKRCGVVCAPYAVIGTETDLAAVSAALLPGILKTARLGYDGKGQRRVSDRAELAAAWAELGEVACVLEKLLPLAFECSVIVARGQDGQVVHFPPQRNTHRDGILAVTEAYAQNMPSAQAQRAVEAAKSIAEGLDYVGVLCVEFFVLDNGVLVVNEMAPRPHNSGHWTQDGCDVSQFELQVRTLAGLPLTPPRQHSPTVMLNLLGDLWFAPREAAQAIGAEPASQPAAADTPAEPPWEAVLALPGAHLHLYGKAEARRGRKMGHLNITGADREVVRATARHAAALLGLPLELSS